MMIGYLLHTIENVDAIHLQKTANHLAEHKCDPTSVFSG